MAILLRAGDARVLQGDGYIKDHDSDLAIVLTLQDGSVLCANVHSQNDTEDAKIAAVTSAYSKLNALLANQKAATKDVLIKHGKKSPIDAEAKATAATAITQIKLVGREAWRQNPFRGVHENYAAKHSVTMENFLSVVISAPQHITFRQGKVYTTPVQALSAGEKNPAANDQKRVQNARAQFDAIEATTRNLFPEEKGEAAQSKKNRIEILRVINTFRYLLDNLAWFSSANSPQDWYPPNGPLDKDHQANFIMLHLVSFFPNDAKNKCSFQESVNCYLSYINQFINAFNNIKDDADPDNQFLRPRFFQYLNDGYCLDMRTNSAIELGSAKILKLADLWTYISWKAENRPPLAEFIDPSNGKDFVELLVLGLKHARGKPYYEIIETGKAKQRKDFKLNAANLADYIIRNLAPELTSESIVKLMTDPPAELTAEDIQQALKVAAPFLTQDIIDALKFKKQQLNAERGDLDTKRDELLWNIDGKTILRNQLSIFKRADRNRLQQEIADHKRSVQAVDRKIEASDSKRELLKKITETTDEQRIFYRCRAKMFAEVRDIFDQFDGRDLYVLQKLPDVADSKYDNSFVFIKSEPITQSSLYRRVATDHKLSWKPILIKDVVTFEQARTEITGTNQYDQKLNKFIKRVIKNPVRLSSFQIKNLIEVHTYYYWQNLKALSLDNITDPETGDSALHYAVAESQPNLVAELLMRGMDPKAENKEKISTIQLACKVCKDGKSEATRIAVINQFIAAPNLTPIVRGKLLLWLCHYNFWDQALNLFETYASVPYIINLWQYDPDGDYPVHILVRAAGNKDLNAATKEKIHKVLAFYIKNCGSTDPNFKNKNPQHPISTYEIALSFNDYTTIAIMLLHSVQFAQTIPAAMKTTVFNELIKIPRFDLISQLLQTFNVIDVTSNKDIPFLAAAAGEMTILLELHKRGVNLHLPNKEGDTPKTLAEKNGKNATVASLAPLLYTAKQYNAALLAFGEIQQWAKLQALLTEIQQRQAAVDFSIARQYPDKTTLGDVAEAGNVDLVTQLCQLSAKQQPGQRYSIAQLTRAFDAAWAKENGAAMAVIILYSPHEFVKTLTARKRGGVIFDLLKGQKWDLAHQFLDIIKEPLDLNYYCDKNTDKYALHFAAEAGQKELCRKLCERGANPLFRNKDHQLALAQQLLNDEKPPIEQYSDAFIQYAENGSWQEYFELALDFNKPFDVNKRFWKSPCNTAMHCAVQRGYFSVVQNLLNLVGAAPNILNDEKEAPLDLALRLPGKVQKTNIVALLISKPAYIKTINNATLIAALLFLAQENCWKEIGDFLTANPRLHIDVVNAYDLRTHQSLLHYAAQALQKDVFIQLCERGANPNLAYELAQNQNNLLLQAFILIHAPAFASKLNRLTAGTIENLLLELAKINEWDVALQLLQACKSDLDPVIDKRPLVKVNLYRWSKDYFRYKLVHFAAAAGKAEFIAELRNKGAIFLTLDDSKEPQTPAELARGKQFADIAAEIEKNDEFNLSTSAAKYVLSKLIAAKRWDKAFQLFDKKSISIDTTIDNNDETALFKAIRQANLDAVIKLCEKGASIVLQNKDKRLLPLEVAVINGQHKIAAYLICKQFKQFSSLVKQELAQEMFDFLCAKDKLQQLNATLDEVNHSGDGEAGKLVHDYMKSNYIPSKERRGKILLNLAQAGEWVLLHDFGNQKLSTEMNYQNDNLSRTALHFAVAANIKKHINISAQLKIIQLLCEIGADPLVVDKDNKTAFQLLFENPNFSNIRTKALLAMAKVADPSKTISMLAEANQWRLIDTIFKLHGLPSQWKQIQNKLDTGGQTVLDRAVTAYDNDKIPEQKLDAKHDSYLPINKVIESVVVTLCTQSNDPFGRKRSSQPQPQSAPVVSAPPISVPSSALEIKAAKSVTPLEKALNQKAFDLVKVMLAHGAPLLSRKEIKYAVYSLLNNQQLNIDFLSKLTDIKIDLYAKRNVAVRLIQQLIDEAKTPIGVLILINKLDKLKNNNQLNYLHDRRKNGFFQKGHQWKGHDASATWVNLMKMAKNKIAELILQEKQIAKDMDNEYKPPERMQEIKEFLGQNTLFLSWCVSWKTKSLDIINENNLMKANHKLTANKNEVTQQLSAMLTEDDGIPEVPSTAPRAAAAA